jgi:predicted O-methyltransferase YrrM
MTDITERQTDYVNKLFVPQDAAAERALTESPQRGLPAISIQPQEGRFLQFLVRAAGTKKALEIGTLGGFSGIWIARGLVSGGKLITLERSPEHAAVAREHFDAAGLQDTVEIRLGDAHETLKTIGSEGPFDFIFIDAEKSGYIAYYEWAIANVRVGGVIAAHNAFRQGMVVDPDNNESETNVMRKFNEHVAKDPRGLATIYPAGDGTVVVVRIK